jgi:DNA-binding MarR family transcriptional regulator
MKTLTPEHRIRQFLRKAHGSRTIARLAQTLKLDEARVKRAVAQLVAAGDIKELSVDGRLEYDFNDRPPNRSTPTSPTRAKRVSKPKAVPARSRKRQLKPEPPHQENLRRTREFLSTNAGHHRQMDIAKALGLRQHLVERALDSLIHEGSVRVVSLRERIFTANDGKHANVRSKSERRIVRTRLVDVVGGGSKASDRDGRRSTVHRQPAPTAQRGNLVSKQIKKDVLQYLKSWRESRTLPQISRHSDFVQDDIQQALEELEREGQIVCVPKDGVLSYETPQAGWSRILPKKSADRPPPAQGRTQPKQSVPPAPAGTSPSRSEHLQKEVLNTTGHTWKLPKDWKAVSSNQNSILSMIPERYWRGYRRR